MSKDMLTEMFETQKSLQKKLGTEDKIKTESDKQLWINQNILAIVEETVEIMRETGYKNPEYVKFGWKKGQKWDIDKYKEEIVDLWHFVMNLCNAVDFTPEEFYHAYMSKNQKNRDRKDNNY